MRRLIVLFVLCYGLVAPCMAGANTGGNVVDPADLEVFLDSLVVAQMDSLHLPGVIVSVVEGDRIVLTKGYGYARLEEKVLASSESVFAVGSVTKVFTATAVAQLIDRGQLHPDDPVQQYLTSFKLPEAFAQPITVQHLLTHTAGFEDHIVAIGTRDRRAVVGLGDFLARGLPRQVVAPGQVYNYSNYGIALAGHVVEQVSGKAFGAYLQQEVLAPLDMGLSNVVLTAPMRDKLATGYAYRAAADTFEPLPIDYVHVAPAGALYSTAADMAHFMIAHLQDGRFRNRRILSAAGARMMRQRQFSNHPRQWGVGYVFTEHHRNGQPAFGHDGGRGGFFSFFFLLPEKQVGFFVSTNAQAFNNAVVGLEEWFLDAFFNRYFPAAEAGPETRPAPDLAEGAQWAGTYQTLRYSHHTLTKFISLLLRVNIVDHGDGSLGLVLPFENEPSRWWQAEPGLYRNVDKSGKGSISFRDSPDGARYMAWNHVAFERTVWHQATMLHLGAFGFSAVTFLSALAWPLGYLVRLRRGVRERAPLIGRPHSVVGLMALLHLIFIAGMVIAVGQLLEITYGVPASLMVLLCLPVMAAALAFIAGYQVWKIWRRRSWSLGRRAHFSLVVMGNIVFTAQLYYWNLLGFQF